MGAINGILMGVYAVVYSTLNFITALFLNDLLYLQLSVSSFKRVCYYTNWSQSRPAGGRFTPDDIDPYLCTHIIFAYARIVADEIQPTEWNDEDTQHLTGQ